MEGLPMMQDEVLEQKFIAAALNLAELTMAHGFTIPVPNTTPPLFVSLHEGPVQLGAPTSAAPPDKQELSDAARDVLAELAKATKKFPTWPTDPLHALAVLGEEFGELTKDMLQLTYEPHKTSAANVRKEAVQTAAMALRLYMSLDRYQYRQCEQHEQEGQP